MNAILIVSSQKHWKKTLVNFYSLMIGKRNIFSSELFSLFWNSSNLLCNTISVASTHQWCMDESKMLYVYELVCSSNIYYVITFSIFINVIFYYLSIDFIRDEAVKHETYPIYPMKYILKWNNRNKQFEYIQQNLTNNIRFSTAFGNIPMMKVLIIY